MRVVQTVFGTFHHFDLAHELDRRGYLQAIYSTFPWQRLKREGLALEQVHTFPWLHTPAYLLERTWPNAERLHQGIRWTNIHAFDRWTSRRIAALERSGTHIDALIGISGTSLHTGAHVQRGGGAFICDRGSTHQRYQYKVLTEEYERWRVPAPTYDMRIVAHEEAIYAQADAITVPSSACVRSFVEMGVPASKLHRIPYGVNLQRFHPVGEPSADRFDCLFAGQVSLRKGVPYLLQAFAALRHPRKRLRVAGAVQPELQSLLSHFSTDAVEFIGPVPQTKLIELMSTSHVLLLPSVEEGLALVQAQAMACGCPVICSDATGGEDLFQDGTAGYVIPVRDVAAITARLQQLANDPVLQAAMRAAAQEQVRRLGGWQQYGDAWEALLLQLTAQTSAR